MEKNFTLPTDVTKFWVAPYGEEGTTDEKEKCFFCGRPRYECALENTKFWEKVMETETNIQKASVDMVEGPGENDPDGPCCNSGLWCTGCGRFWAETADGCGGYLPQACDGAELAVDGGLVCRVRCACGKLLMLTIDEAG